MYIRKNGPRTYPCGTPEGQLGYQFRLLSICLIAFDLSKTLLRISLIFPLKP